jgi:hypothetical protein
MISESQMDSDPVTIDFFDRFGSTVFLAVAVALVGILAALVGDL